ncbi:MULTISPECIES: helix-turn-helix domain-containing protein [unclassified Bradyrhizobium]|uniref:helix-turn-helix domain-containing protein n=1 Tax=Bradyrhizobium sp. USDA 4541 TaxID=2817704 RepID=UPI0035C70DB2
MHNRPTAPTIEGIRSGLVAEGQRYEFKARLNLDEQRGKSNFVDDVVAFLNAGSGYLIVGVHEKKGAFERFEPMDGDRDALQRRITSIIQDNIDPRPLGAGVEFLDLDTGGFIVSRSARASPAALSEQDHWRLLYAHRRSKHADPPRPTPCTVHADRKAGRRYDTTDGA